MRARHVTLLAFIMVLPSFAAAQRGGGGMGGMGRSGGRRPGGSGGESRGENAGLSNKDLEEISPIKLLIDKRKDLKLEDAKVKGLKQLESAMKKQNEPFFKALDSLRDEMKRRGSGTSSDGERARVINARTRFGQMVDSIRAHYDATLDLAMPQLDSTQKSSAEAFIQQQNIEARLLIERKLGGREGGG